MKLLMSAATSGAAASLVRHLQALGHFVVGMDANACAADYGRYLCDEFILAPLATSADYPGFLASIANRFDLFIPFLDEELFLFAQGRISPDVARKTLLSDPETLNICLDKKRFQEFCSSRRLPVAATADAPPAVFKPRFGRGGKGVVMLEDQALLDYYAQKDGVLQRRISGIEYTVDALFGKMGELLFAVPRKRLEAAGVSRIGEIEFNPAVLKVVEHCAAELRFRYAVNIQVIQASDGSLHLLEINPRLAGSVIFTIMAGFDLLEQAVRLYRDEPVVIPARGDLRSLRIVRHWSEVAFDAGRIV